MLDTKEEAPRTALPLMKQRSLRWLGLNGFHQVRVDIVADIYETSQRFKADLTDFKPAEDAIN